MLHRLVYLSSARGLPLPADLDDILDQSRRNNRRDGISGLLLYYDGNFFQVLEGAPEQVCDCFARIKQDTRHYDCQVMLSTPADGRLFADWEMAYIPFASLTADQRQGVIDLLAFRHSHKMDELSRDKATTAFANAFLLSLRDLQPA